MAIYLTGSGNISPQQTWEQTTLDVAVHHQGVRLNAIEPDYTQLIDPKILRRMSRVMTMGAAAAILALKNSGVEHPDGIITGTGFGCLQDTGNFLSRMVSNKEEALNPTPFIQSTHNTISGQLAFLLQCQEYNLTYTSNSFSFEHALLDAMLLIEEQGDRNILVGGVDEITDASHAIQKRFGIFKSNSQDNLELYNVATPGTLHGEGSAWFVVSGSRENGSVHVEGVETFSEPASIQNSIIEFLSNHEITADNIDLVLSGKSGDLNADIAEDVLLNTLFSKSTLGVFKHLCGEYPTASAFALWLAEGILKTGKVPDVVMRKDAKRSIGKILILNQYFQTHYSVILLSRS